MTDNDAKVLVEFSAAEVAWLADRLHELRVDWTAAALMKAQVIQQRGEVSENERKMVLELEMHKQQEQIIRNRLLRKAADQGFGDL